MRLEDALAVVKAHGYRVTKPRARPAPKPLGLNAIGKPYGAGFDPNYRMKYRTPALKRGGQSVNGYGLGETGETKWFSMCRLAEVEALRMKRMLPSEVRFISPQQADEICNPKPVDTSCLRRDMQLA